ncbi:MAG: hypothetical protein HYY25_13520 [Candidatus Wallbacteria bacterium]|nr:hypothetical protein [Candidatus Wallbacteria bacterium]
MKRMVLAGLLVLLSTGSAQAFLELSDPRLVQAIDARSGDVYLRLKDKRNNTGGVYRFRRTDQTFTLVGQWLFSIGQSSGLAVDKFARVTVLEDSGTGGRKALSALTPPVPDGAVLQINKATGSLSILNLGAPQKQATAPDTGTAFATPNPSFDYVPAPHTLLNNRWRVRVHSDHGFGGWVANNSGGGPSRNPDNGGTTYANMLTGLNQWYVSDINGRNAHGGIGPNLARAKSGWYEANLFRIKNWISTADFDTFPVPGLDLANKNALVALGDPITSSLATGYELEFFSSCGDRCLASAGSDRVESTLRVPAKIVFSSEGLSAEAQRVYGIQSTGNNAVVLRYVLANNIWTNQGVDASDVIDGHSLRTSGTIQTFGVAAKSRTSDYIYRSELPGTSFSVSGKFFRDGATIYGYKPSDGTVEWEDRSEVSGSITKGKVTGLGDQIRAITSDGRFNLYYFVQEKNPADTGITAAFDAINASNPQLVTNPLAPGPFRYEDTVLELPGGRTTETTEVVETVVETVKIPLTLCGIAATGGSCVQPTLGDNTKTIQTVTKNPDGSTSSSSQAFGTAQVGYNMTITMGAEIPGNPNEHAVTISVNTAGVPAVISGNVKYAQATQEKCTQVAVPTTVVTSLPKVETVSAEKATTSEVSITTTHETTGCAIIFNQDVGGHMVDKITTVTKRKTTTTYFGTLARKFYYRQTQQFGLHSVNVDESKTGGVTDARTKALDRGGIILDSQIWTRTAHKAPGDPKLAFKASDAPEVDAAFTGGVVDYDLDADSIKLTDPPITKEKLAVLDFKPDSGTPLVTVEDFPENFEMENYPSWSGISAGPYGKMNQNYIGEDQDGDGVAARVGDTYYQSEFKCKWVVKAVSEPLKSAYNNGVRTTKPSQSNNGIVFPVTSATSSVAADAPGETAGWSTSGAGESPAVRFTYNFRDPGEYEVQLQIKGKYFDTSGLTFANTADDVKLAEYGPDSARSGQNGYVYVAPRKEIVRVTALVPIDKQYVWDIDHKGPSQVPEDSTTATDANNWFAEGLVRYYNGINYDYYKNQLPSPADMKKYSGVGQYIYPSVDQTKLTVQDWIAIRDGVSDFGTRVDGFKREDFEAVTYEWYLKATDPIKPSQLVPTGIGAQIASGTLAELWDLQNVTSVTGPAGSPSSPAALRRALLGTGAATSDVLTFLPASLINTPRTVEVRIPLMSRDLARALAAGRGTQTVVLPRDLRVAFNVPTDPTAIQLACRIKYPRVKWVNTAQPGRTFNGRTVYYDLVDDPGDWYGYYKKSRLAGVFTDTPKWLNLNPAIEDGDDYVETVVFDTTTPWVSAQGNSKTFDPVKYGSVQQMEFATPARVETGKALPLAGYDNLYRVFVVDNNPYVHFNSWEGTSRDDMWPKLSKFHYEVGDDIRIRDTVYGGVGLKEGTGHFGFDISHTGNIFNLSRTDFPGDSGENQLPTQSSYVYGYDRIKTWGPFGNGVSFDNIQGNSVPAFNTTSSYSRILADISKWARTDWTNVTNQTARDDADRNYRVTQWDFKDMDLPMPIFLDNRPNLLAKAGAEGEDRDVARTGANPSAAARKSGPSQVGTNQVFDVDPPNILVELVEFKGALPVFFAAAKDYSRGWSASPVDLVNDWQVFKASADSRDVYKAFPSESRPGITVLPATSATRMAQTTVLDFRDPSAWAPPGASFNYRLEEDVRFRLTVKAADNGSDARNIGITIKGVEGTAQQHFPATVKEIGETGIDTGGVAALQGTHFYPSAGESDTIHIEAKDLAGNTREMVLHLDVTEHESNYRVIGNTNRQVR